MSSSSRAAPTLRNIRWPLALTRLCMVAESAWLPNWAFSVDRRLSDKIKKDIQSALLLLKPNHPVMKALKIESFRSAADSDYQPVRLAAGLE